jgi:hypothetical protein
LVDPRAKRENLIKEELISLCKPSLSLRNPPPPCEDYPPPLSEVYSLLFVAFHLLTRLNNHLPDFAQYIGFLFSLFLLFSYNPKKKKKKKLFPFRSE